ncbi:unnamed protein product, partial [Brenthis ino]
MKVPTLFFLAFFGFSTIVLSQDFGEVYCGRRLATALALLCDNSLIKRSEMQQNVATDTRWPWLTSHRAHSMGRSKRQVVSECCDKPCTINELMSYCGAF